MSNELSKYAALALHLKQIIIARFHTAENIRQINGFQEVPQHLGIIFPMPYFHKTRACFGLCIIATNLGSLKVLSADQLQNRIGISEKNITAGILQINTAQCDKACSNAVDNLLTVRPRLRQAWERGHQCRYEGR